MTQFITRNIRLGLSILVFAAVLPAGAEWLQEKCKLPAGYGAEGDRQRAVRMPGAVRNTVKKLSAGSEGSWLKESSTAGGWGYELHLYNDGESSVIQLSPSGHVLRTTTNSDSIRVATVGG